MHKRGVPPEWAGHLAGAGFALRCWLCCASADVVMRRVYGALLVAMLVVCTREELQKSEREKPHSGETNQHAPTQTPCNQPAIAVLTHAQNQHDAQERPFWRRSWGSTRGTAAGSDSGVSLIPFLISSRM